MYLNYSRLPVENMESRLLNPCFTENLRPASLLDTARLDAREVWEFSIYNVYCPNNIKQRIAFLEYVRSFIETHTKTTSNVIIGGDFNCVDNETDKVSKTSDKSSSKLESLKSDLHVADIWRKMNPYKTEYTYIDPSGRGKHSRIDTFLLNKVASAQASSCSIQVAPTPDHRAVLLSINLKTRSRGKGYWKINNSVLAQPGFQQHVDRIINETLNEYEDRVPNSLLWEYLKFQIKHNTINYCIKQAKIKYNIWMYNCKI